MKTVAAIFAHPDDEAMGPGGTLAHLAQNNNVYLLCATKGHAGNNSNPKTKEKIFRIRTQEVINSAKTLGIKKVSFLGFRDGYLCNNNYHRLADKIQQKLEEIKPEIIITFEPRGVSGHIDHIAVSMVSTYVFYKLPFIKQLLYYCMDEQHRSSFKEYFIYMPPGYQKTEINHTVDISGVWDKKIEAIKHHKSQQHDVENIINIISRLPREEHFVVLNK